MARTKVTFNDSGMKAIDRAVDKDLERRADRVLQSAQASAPVLSGAYRSGLHVERDANADGPDTFRVAGSSNHDIYVEADTGNLARSLDAAAD